MKKLNRFYKFLTAGLVFAFAFGFLCAQSEEAAEEETASQYQERIEKIEFGLESEIEELIDVLISDEDFEYSANLKELFLQSKSTTLRNKIIDYFIAAKDLSLEEQMLAVFEDPMAEKKSTADKFFNYAEKLEIKSAGEPLRAILEDESSPFLSNAVKTLGKCGSVQDAALMAELLKKEDNQNTRHELVVALGNLGSAESYQTVADIAKDSSESLSMRMAAIEAMGKIPNEDTTAELAKLYEDRDANFRVSVIKAVAQIQNPEAEKILIEAVKDNHYKVRLAALTGVIDQKLVNAEKVVLYRAKNDSENVVKEKSFEALAAIGTPQAVEYLLKVAEDKKRSDSNRAKAASYLLKYCFDDSVYKLTDIARVTLSDDKQKNVRYALGREFAKYENIALMDICREYLASDDVSTKGTGLDIYAKNAYGSLRPDVSAIAEDKKAGVNQKKAKNVLEKIDRAAGFIE